MLNRVTPRRAWPAVSAIGLGAALIVLVGRAELPAQPPAKGAGKDENFVADRDVFHFLLANRADIKRTVKETKSGVETVTESDKPEVAKKIQEHVAAMHARVKSGKGIHYRDPLFAEIFKHYDKIVMKAEKTEKGVKVTETSDDEYVAKLIRAHAGVVTKFNENGHTEVQKNHPLPDKPEPKKP